MNSSASAMDRSSFDPMRQYRALRDRERRSVQSKYDFLGFISSGTYGRVYKVLSKDEEERKLYAIKKFKPDKEGDVVTYTGISQSAIREIAVRTPCSSPSDRTYSVRSSTEKFRTTILWH